MHDDGSPQHATRWRLCTTPTPLRVRVRNARLATTEGRESLAPEESRRYTRLMPTAPDDDDDALAVASARSRPPDALVPSTCPPRKEDHGGAARRGAVRLWLWSKTLALLLWPC